jgi:tetratricopeptide (TPR) repeat protein
MGRRLGLIIGVNKYQDAAFRPLKFAETDARAIAQWLVNAQGGKWSPADVQLVLGAQATSELVESLVTQVCVNMARPDDVVLIYFAGHAFLDERKNEGHLALANTYYNQPATGLNVLSLALNVLGKSRASQILVILDCFQTGNAWNMRRSSLYDSKPVLGLTLLKALQQWKGRMFLCSCRGNATTPEVGERNLGLLAHRLIVGLSDSARDGATGQVTLQRLHAFLFSALGEQHRPQLFGQGQLVLAGNTLAAPESLSQWSDSQRLRATTSSRLRAQTAQGSVATEQLLRQMSPTTSEAYAHPAVEEKRLQQSAMALHQAKQLMKMQNPGEAYRLVDQVLQNEPNNANALILKGQILGMAGRFPEALSAVEQVIRQDDDNALAWSMRAAILTNMGQFLDALPAVERALDLDPRNTETHAIKETIMANLAPTRGALGDSQSLLAAGRRGGPASFFIGTGIQLLGLAIGSVGAGLPIVRPGLPIYAALALASLGLAILCVNAARGSYRYGAARFLLTVLTSAVAAGVIAGAYKFGYQRIIQFVIAHQSLFASVLFAIGWLALAAVIPLLLAFGGLVGGIGYRARRRRQ